MYIEIKQALIVKYINAYMGLTSAVGGIEYAKAEGLMDGLYECILLLRLAPIAYEAKSKVCSKVNKTGGCHLVAVKRITLELLKEDARGPKPNL